MFKKIIAVIIAAALSVGMLSTSAVAASKESKNKSATSSGEWKNFGKALTSKEISSYEELVSAIEYAIKMCAPTIKLKLSKNYQYGRDFDLNDIAMISECRQYEQIYNCFYRLYVSESRVLQRRILYVR